MVCPGGSPNKRGYQFDLKTRFYDTPSMSPIPPLSLETETWLQGRSDRHQWVEQLDQNLFTMIWQCSLHETSVRLVLTELSPCGTCLIFVALNY
jgi:hypothetical protein